jgi:hypothetical protein
VGGNSELIDASGCGVIADEDVTYSYPSPFLIASA